MHLSMVPASHPGLDVAIIMDGNGRWGVTHSKMCCDGHGAGASTSQRKGYWLR